MLLQILEGKQTLTLEEQRMWLTRLMRDPESTVEENSTSTRCRLWNRLAVKEMLRHAAAEEELHQRKWVYLALSPSDRIILLGRCAKGNCAYSCAFVEEQVLVRVQHANQSEKLMLVSKYDFPTYNRIYKSHSWATPLLSASNVDNLSVMTVVNSSQRFTYQVTFPWRILFTFALTTSTPTLVCCRFIRNLCTGLALSW